MLSKHKIPHLQAPDCRSVTQSSRSSFLTSFGFLPKEKAEALTRVYAFFRIADDCVDELTEKHEKQAALDYWKTQLINMYRGNPSHPVMAELYSVVRKYQIPQDYFLGLLEGCEMDIEKKRYQTFDELHDYCYRVAGLVGLTCMKIFEYQSPTSEQMAVDLGMAFQLTNIIRDLNTDLKLDRIYIPLNDMKLCGYSEDELINQIENQGFYNLMNYYYEKAQGYYDSAFQEFKMDSENKLVAAKVMARFYRSILKKIKRKHFPVFHKKVSLNFFEKAYLIMPFLV